MSLLRKRKYKNQEIAPEDIFLDSSNLPDFDPHQLEGRIEKPIGRKTVMLTGAFFIIVGLLFFGRAYDLQIKNGYAYTKQSEENHLQNSLIFADRGIIEDRNGVKLAWNMPPDEEGDFSKREYTDLSGMNNLLGFIKYPSKDNNGFFYKEDISGQDGVEQYFNADLAGANGSMIVETDAKGNVESHSTVRPPEPGHELALSIDSRVTNMMYEDIKKSSDLSGFQGGAGVIMNVHTGEVLAMTTYPEYSSQVLSDGTNTPAIQAYLTDPKNVFLDRTIAGLYTPGSIVKPFISLGVLNEGVISPDKKILSTGSISIPNPYFPDKPSVFHDWRVNGWTDLQEALSVSSDVYFYEVGGGYEGQPGLGIQNIDKYMSLFGFGKPIANSFFTGKAGIIPTPEWKAANFDGDPWRVGDTYNTSIGQFGFQMTAIQAVRAVAAIANGGTLVDPVIKKSEPTTTETITSIPENDYDIVRGGMRLAVTDGTMTSLNFPNVQIAGKTGTAELGTTKSYINSWATGFFPYDNPQYAFALVLEKGPSAYREGAQAVIHNLFVDMASSTPEYLN